MALLRPRLSLGLGLGPSSVSLARRLKTGPPRRPEEEEEEAPTIALGSPPPPSPPTAASTSPYTSSTPHPSGSPYTSASAPGASGTGSSAYPGPAQGEGQFNPSASAYADAMKELGNREEVECVAPPDVRVRLEGAKRGTRGEEEAPLLLTGDAPLAGVPKFDPPTTASGSTTASSSFASDTLPPSFAASSSDSASSTSSTLDSDSAPAVNHSASSTSNASSSATSSTSSAESAPPTQEEWEKRYEDLQAAYRKKMADLRAGMDERLKKLAVHTGETLALVSQKVNEVTGYREVERLKQSVKDREREISVGRRNVREAKKAYEDAVATLSSTQQSVNALLERKHSWTDNDVANFTKLVRSDHASRSAVTTTNEALKNSELAVDKAFTGLMQSILERYHEEQVWSDKIRSVSTWAQVAALVANLVVFVGAIAFIEPWKRRRLVQGLEERVSGMMGRVEGEIATLSERVEGLDGKMALAATTMASSAGITTPAPPQAPDAEAILAAAGLAGEETGEADPQAEAVAQLVGSLLSDALSDVDSHDAYTPTYPTSPLEQVANDSTRADTLTSRSLHWVNAQLGHFAAPSAERDLAAASVLGAAAGVAVVGLFTVVAGLVRS